ncbi:MAG TPA: nickel pincer cofactor biosynthesis protein LarC [Actinomycetota bacterium]|nr:nickel pincer cofactor biosynthesis protein LarC [Actinomycetota bacterium]
MSTLFFDCFSGAAGDMILGALLDAGAPEAQIREMLGGLEVGDWRLEVSTVDKGGFRATRARFSIPEHDLGRNFYEVEAIVAGAALSEDVKTPALRAFTLLADAEATVHGTSRAQAHFHEVGTTDAILDVVAAFAALRLLAPERTVTSAIATGVGGLAETSHGRIPVPAPAVAQLFATHGVPVFQRGSTELITPTGAAILVAASESFGDMPEMTLERVGYGAGSKDLDHPNVVRAMLGQEIRDGGPDATLIEANLDDISPELIPYLIERLLAGGALDAWVTPVLMKKGRPAFVLSALASPAGAAAAIELVFQESTTLGLRTSTVSRHVLERDWTEVDVAGVPVRVKRGWHRGRIVTAAPEYDDARRAAEETGLPLKEVFARVLEAADSSRVTP